MKTLRRLAIIATFAFASVVLLGFSASADLALGGADVASMLLQAKSG